MASMARATNAAQAGSDAVWSGDTGSVGGAGVSGRDEAGSPFNGDGGVEGGKADDGIGVVGGKIAGCAANGGVAGTDRGERSNSFSSRS